MGEIGLTPLEKVCALKFFIGTGRSSFIIAFPRLPFKVRIPINIGGNGLHIFIIGLKVCIKIGGFYVPNSCIISSISSRSPLYFPGPTIIRINFGLCNFRLL